MTHKLIKNGFIMAGLVNLVSPVVLSRAFTNETMLTTDPKVMSAFGLVMIMVWGAAYISVAENYQKVKWLVAVFAIEKLIYGIVWTKWIMNNEVSPVFEQDTMAGVFFSIYGINDWIFCIFFTLVFFKVSKIKG